MPEDFEAHPQLSLSRMALEGEVNSVHGLMSLHGIVAGFYVQQILHVLDSDKSVETTHCYRRGISPLYVHWHLWNTPTLVNCMS